MRYLHNTIRVILAVLMLATAGSKFGFLPTAAYSPEMFTAEGWLLISAISSNGYLFPVIGIVSLLCGLALLFNRYVALAAIVYIPITLNFTLFHLFLGLPLTSIQMVLREAMPYVFFLLNVYVLWSERSKYSVLLE